MDFPSVVGQKPTISVLSAEAVGALYRLLGGATPASSAWPSANRAIFIPFSLAAPFQMKKVWWANGATANANIDCGVYSAGGTLLGSIGSTAQAGTSVVQSATLSLSLTPGAYYMALVLSATTGTILRTSGLTAAAGLPAAGIAQQASALPLPATATFATAASSYVPLFGITSQSVI